jgi:acyl carrier protein
MYLSFEGIVALMQELGLPTAGATLTGSLRDDLQLDGLQTLALIMQLEDLGMGTLPCELVESIDTVEELIYYYEIRRRGSSSISAKSDEPLK